MRNDVNLEVQPYYQFLNKNNSGTTRCVMKMNENSMHAVIHFSHTVPNFWLIWNQKNWGELQPFPQTCTLTIHGKMAENVWCISNTPSTRPLDGIIQNHPINRN